MAVSHGMDVGEVRRLGGSLQSTAESIDGLIRDVDRLVGGSSWAGPDAVRFKTQWWPGHKARLGKVSRDLHGLGQSALNNAAEQEDASRAGGAGEASVGVPMPPGPGDVPSDPIVDGDVVQGDGPESTGGVDVDEENLEAEFVQDWQSGGTARADALNFLRPPAGTGNCTSYTAWRLNDLAEKNGLDWTMSNNHVGDVRLTRLGNASEWDEHAREIGIPVDNQPLPGAVAQWEESYADGGHVAIVRSVDADGVITIEQSSWGGDVFDVVTLKPGDAGYPHKFIHMLPGT